MSTQKWADFSFDEEGGFTVDVTGFDGKGCEAFTKAITDVLGKVTKMVPKAPARKLVAPAKNRLVR